MIEIKFTKKIDLKDYTLFEGFPGIGLVGTIASGYLVEQMKMEPIGYIYSDKFPPMTTIHKGRPYFPARLYCDQKNKILVLLAEFVIPSTIVYEISSEILNFVKKQGIKQIISLAGMTTPQAQETKNIYGIAANDKIAKFMETNDIKMIKEGVTTGVSGILISMCATQGIDAMSLLAESKYGYPDPNSAANLIDKLSSLYKLKIDTAELRKESGKIESNMKAMLEKMRQAKTSEGEEEALPKGAYPSMYE